LHMNRTSFGAKEMNFDFNGRTAIVTGAGQGYRAGDRSGLS
jgi:hypothetical protein